MRGDIKPDKRALVYSLLVEGSDVVIDASAVVDASVELSVVVDAIVLVEGGADVVVCTVLDVPMFAVDCSVAVIIEIGDKLKEGTKYLDNILTL